jgi:TonB family protein
MGNAQPQAASNAGDARPKEAAPQAARPKADSDCGEDATKPKPQGGVPQAAYTDAARSAGVEGRVKLTLRVDATGNVISATVSAGLGSGLDEAAVAAAKRAKFSPAMKCGKAVEGTYILSMRFVLGE